MAKDEFDSKRPSRDSAFTERVAASMMAAVGGDAAAMRTLLAQDDSIANAAGDHPIWGGRPQPLHLAAERNHVDVARALIANGANVNGDNAGYDDWSPLMLAAHGGRLGLHPPRPEIVTLLLDAGAELDVFAAAVLDDTDRLAECLRSSPDAALDAGPAGAFPLHFARSKAAVELLLRHGGDPNAVCGWGTTPLERAAFRGSAGNAVAEALMAGGAEPHANVLACLGDIERLSKFLDENPLELETKRKVAPSIIGTPLHGAAANGELATVQLLIDRGADVNARADNGQSPLHLCNSHLEVTKTLVDNGADPNARDGEHDNTPLGWARFFIANLAQDEPELPEVIAYLETVTGNEPS